MNIRLLFASASLLAFTQGFSPVSAQTASVQQDVITGIQVEGNQRVEAGTVRSYLGLKEGSPFAPAAMDKGLKSLFSTGFFSDVKLYREGGTLIVRVVENPVINRVSFEGNNRIDTGDLEKEIELKARSIYTKAKVQSDVKRLLDIYRRSGRYTATVVPKLVPLDQNRADIVYEITEGPVARVEKISFIGNNIFSTSELQAVIRTAEERWWRFLNDNDKYDADRTEFDKELLRRFYTSQGYADFQVKSAHAELAPDKDSFYLTYVIDEGPKYVLSSVDVDSSLKGEEVPDFKGIITTRTGQDYNATRVEESVENMTKELGNRGYAFVDIAPKLKRDKDKNTIDLVYQIKPGPRVYVERINITGNMRTLDEVIRREFRLAEGDPYNAAKLARTEQRLKNLGFFERVEITNEQGSAPDRTVINVDVAEKSTGEINLGVGFSSTDGALADFGIKESNLLGRGQELNTRFTWATRRKQAQLGFTEPYFLNRELSAGFDIYRTQLDYQDESSYDITSTGFNLRSGYALSEHLGHSVYYTARSNDITDVKPTASRFIRDQEGKNTVSAVGQALTWDTRNNRFDPSNGYYLKVSQEVAGLGGNSRYLKHELRTSYYYPWAKSWIFSVGGGAGHVFGYSDRDVRISDRFFVGGDLIRGFANSGIGPRDTLTRDALGGNSYYVGSLEQRFPLGLPEELGITAAAFFDVGTLWGLDTTGPEVADNSNLRMSAGLGLAWQSPFGPIRIDLARPIKKEKFDEDELFRFSFGTRF